MKMFHQLSQQEQESSIDYQITEVLHNIVHGNEIDLSDYSEEISEKIISFEMTEDEIMDDEDSELMFNRFDEIMEDEQCSDVVIDMAITAAHQALYIDDDTNIVYTSDLIMREDKQDKNPVEEKTEVVEDKKNPKVLN